MPDHVHMRLSIPPKYSVSQVVGYIKGKSAIHLARVYGERHQGFIGQHFWARDISFRRSVGTRGSSGTASRTKRKGPAIGSTQPLALTDHLQVAE